MVIAAAQDTGGEAVAGQWYDAANTTYPSLIDDKHVISSLFNLLNVPSTVWIDETGKIVRIDEGSYAQKHEIQGFRFGREGYAQLIKDWIEKGDKSAYINQSLSAVRAKTDHEAKAEAAFNLGVYFQKNQNRSLAQQYFQTAQQLNPDSWNYHRQDWTYDGEDKARENWQQKIGALGDKAYYAPIKELDDS